uniref:Uncharacterized protein n=1 Tax=Salix viminalis TaxID=40686 RepID=A0A6N2N136_SALVM
MAQYKKHRLTIEGNLEPSTSSPIHLCSSRSLLETWHNTRNIVLPQKSALLRLESTALQQPPYLYLESPSVTQRAFSSVKVSQSAAFSFNSIKFFHPRLSQRSLLCSNAVHDEEASAKAAAASADSGAPTMNCAVTQRAFSNVKVSQSAAFSFNSIKSFHRRLSQRTSLVLHREKFGEEDVVCNSYKSMLFLEKEIIARTCSQCCEKKMNGVVEQVASEIRKYKTSGIT